MYSPFKIRGFTLNFSKFRVSTLKWKDGAGSLVSSLVLQEELKLWWKLWSYLPPRPTCATLLRKAFVFVTFFFFLGLVNVKRNPIGGSVWTINVGRRVRAIAQPCLQPQRLRHVLPFKVFRPKISSIVSSSCPCVSRGPHWLKDNCGTRRASLSWLIRQRAGRPHCRHDEGNIFLWPGNQAVPVKASLALLCRTHPLIKFSDWEDKGRRCAISTPAHWAV